MADETAQPSEEELRAQLEEQIKRLRVEEVLLQTVVTLVNLSGRRLTAEGEKDLDQARLGIEAVRALLPLCPQEEIGPVRDALAQLQMVYAREAQQPAAGEVEQPAAGEAQQPTAGTGDEAGREQAERARARSKIWTPPGT